MSAATGVSRDCSDPADSALSREREYWEAHEDLDWVADESKAEVAELVPDLLGDVLEICIGSGTYTRGLSIASSRSYTGVDLSHSLLRTLKRRVPDVVGVQADAHHLVFADDSFDVLLVFSGVHHLPRYSQALGEAFRVLRPGGWFFCFEPNSRAWYRVFVRAMRDVVGFYSEDEVDLDPRDVSNALEEKGFDVKRVDFMTPRFRPGYLSRRNRLLARMMYVAGAAGPAVFTRSYFALAAKKPNG